MADNFLTLSDLGKGLNKNELQVRRAFKKLINLGRLVEGHDFERDNAKDELHFVYRINPLRFLEEATKIRSDIKTQETDSILSANGSSAAIISDSPPVPPVNTFLSSDCDPDNTNDSSDSGNDDDDEFDFDTSAIIEFFKDQLTEKDCQIERKDQQMESLTKAIEQSQLMNIELNRAMLFLTTSDRDSSRERRDSKAAHVDISRASNSGDNEILANNIIET